MNKFLNKKDIKKILALIEAQWDCNSELDYGFLINEKNKICIVNRDIEKLDLSKLRINSVGLYFGELNHEQLRLTIEGSQIIGPKAKKNVLELDKEEAKSWMAGNGLEKDTKVKGFVIIKHNDDFLGCGKVKDGRILNFTPKIRRLNVT